MKKYIIPIIFLFLTSSISFAQHVDRYYLEGVWEKTSDFKIDGVISGKIVSGKVNFTRQGDKFIGKYIGEYSSNPSIFEGQGFSKQKKLIYVIQKHPRGSGFQYYGIMSSVMVSPNKFIGTWYDSRGNMGDLIWTRSSYAHEQTGRILTPPGMPEEMPVSGRMEDTTWDFETGNLRGWTATGNAFIYQPTYGDNPTARHRGQPSKHHGNYWIGGYEKRPKPEFKAGDIQGDGPQGSLTSNPFTITTKYISFLIGGGCDIRTVRVELLVNGKIVKQSTGKCNETMTRVRWDVSQFSGQKARIRLVDQSSGGWGHINFDDVRFKGAQAGCRTLAQIYTDGSGDRRTKKLGGNYAAIRLDSLRNDQTLRVDVVSGRLTYVTLHARYQGGYWRTIYKGPKTEFPVGQYIASYKKDRNCTHVNVSINGAHEKYDPVACMANVLVCGAPDKPGPKNIAEDKKKMLANLSLRKPARQSSTGHGGTAQLAVDGNTDGNYFSGSTTHTNHEKKSWWEVDLGAIYKLENVLVYNRTDSCSERLDNFQVLVSVEPFPNSPVTANGYAIKGWTVQKAQNINRINLGKTHGRYVRIQLLGQNYLSLAEVIVNGVSAETHSTRMATTGELSNTQKKLLVLQQLYKEAYQNYKNLLKRYGVPTGVNGVGRANPSGQAFINYSLLLRMHQQIKQGYIQPNQGTDDYTGKVVTSKMKKDVLSQLTQEAYQRYQDLLGERGMDHSATKQAFDLYSLLIDINRQVN